MAAPRVLVADGNIAFLNQTRHGLEEEGYLVEIAGDGRAAVARAKEWHPNLMIVELNLPKLNGWKVLKRVRAIEEIASIPVLFVAERASDAVERKALKLGAEDVLFVGDSPEHDVQGAKRVGMAAALIVDGDGRPPLQSGREIPAKADFEIRALSDLIALVE